MHLGLPGIRTTLLLVSRQDSLQDQDQSYNDRGGEHYYSADRVRGDKLDGSSYAGLRYLAGFDCLPLH